MQSHVTLSLTLIIQPWRGSVLYFKMAQKQTISLIGFAFIPAQESQSRSLHVIPDTKREYDKKMVIMIFEEIASMILMMVTVYGNESQPGCD